MSFLGIGSIAEIIGGVGKVADDLFTSDEERLKIALDDKKIDAGLAQGQLEINKAGAQHRSVFVAGWRPFMGWVGGMSMAYQFLFYPFLTWIWKYLQIRLLIPDDLNPPPVLESDQLWVVISGMLGIAGMRSYDKAKKASV